MRKVTTEDGKNFRPSSGFTFQLLSPDTLVYSFDDVPRNFNFEKLFPLITEGVVLEKKYKDKVQIPFEDSPKVAITTNYAINGIGDSFERRMAEFELTKVYTPKFSPADEFMHTFFLEWDPTEWNSFFHLMIKATQLYMAKGIVESESITGDEKKLQNMFPWKFVEFAKENITHDVEYEIGALFNSFRQRFTDFYDSKQRTFTKWIKDYCRIVGYKWSERHSGHSRFFAFISSNLGVETGFGRSMRLVKSN